MNSIAERSLRPADSDRQEAETPLVPRSATTRRRGKGFTLIEVLLSIVILAAVVSVVYASFSTAGQNIEAAEASRAEVDIARALLRRMIDELGNAFYAQDWHGNPSMKEASFRGKKEEEEVNGTLVRVDSISLTTIAPWRTPGTAESGLREVGYFFREREDGTGIDLFRREKRDPGSTAADAADEVEYKLSDKIAGLRFRYYDGSKWVDEWDLNRLPQLVEIAVVMAGGRVYTTKVETSEFRR